MENIQIFFAGDSTVCDYNASRAPRMGWGQAFKHYVKDPVIVRNYAASGRSSKSFIAENRLEKISREIRENDYLIIQFGHNDAKKDEDRFTDPFTTFQSNLKQYIDVAHKKSAHPILCTPVQRRSFDGDGQFQETHGDYPEAIRKLAKELAIPLIDLTKETRNLYEQLGAEETKKLFLWFEPGEEANYPEGARDDTHFSAEGAHEIAKIVLQAIQSLDLPLARFLDHFS